MKTINLILTDIDNPKKTNNRTYFISDWINFKSKNREKVINNPLKNYKDKFNAYQYLKKFKNIVESSFANYLYLYHDKKYSKIFLRDYCSLWINQYLQFIYIRWLLVKQATKKGHKINIADIKFNFEVNKYLDTGDFIELALESDEFNYYHIKKILNFHKRRLNKKIFFNAKINRLLQNYRFISSKKINKLLLFFQIFFDQIFQFLEKKNYTYLKEGFTLKKLIVLNLKLNQLPFFYFQIFNWNQKKKEFGVDKNIKKNKLNIKNKLFNNFENYIFENIVDDAPSIFFNNLDKISNLEKKITINPKNIISSTSHFYNEIFKFWAFKRKIENKSRLLIFQHGGTHSVLNPIFDYEKKIASSFYEWSRNKKKLSGMIRYLDFNINRKKNRKILFVAMGNRKYPLRLYPGPMYRNEIKTIEYFQNLSKGINKKYRENLFYLPHKNFNSDERKKVLKVIKKEQILKNFSLSENLKNFSLIICSYPMTSFFDCILTGPTLLLIEKKYWVVNKNIKKKYDLLKKNKILFNNTKDLLIHINNIYPHNIDNWWNSKNVSDSINSFLEEFNYCKDSKKFERDILNNFSGKNLI